MGSHFLLQGIFLTQGSNLGLLHCRQILYHLSHQGSRYVYWIGSSNQNHPQEKEMQEGKWLSEEALQIAVKGREAKVKEKRKDIPI